MDNFNTYLVERMVSAKEDLLKKLVCKVRGKHPALISAEDVRGFEFITHELYPGREFIGNEDGLLGEIVMIKGQGEGESITMGYQFIPKSRFDQ